MVDSSTPGHREVLLILGLGDDQVVERQLGFVNRLNENRGEEAQIRVFDTLWQTDETYGDKRQRLSEYVAEHSGIEVVYAISAGASLGMSLVPELPAQTEYHFVSGKLRYPETIGRQRRKRAPALYDSVVASERVISSNDLTKFKMTCHVGFLDGILQQKDMRVPGVKVSRIPMINHSAAIILSYATILRKL